MSKEKELDVLVDVIKFFFPSLFYENGKKKLTYEIKDELEGLCLVTQWYENGQKDSDTNYKLYNSDTTKALEDGLDPDFKKHGMETWWYENGKMKAEINYVDGKRNGSVIQYYENGQKEIEINYVDGKKEGLETQWYDNGKKKSEANYVDDKAKGLATWWYESGQKYYEINYVDGKKEGLETHWDENGQKVAEINFKDDKQHGLQTIWDDNGVKISETEYKDGEKAQKDEKHNLSEAKTQERTTLIATAIKFENIQTNQYLFKPEDSEDGVGTDYNFINGQEIPLIKEIFKVHPKPEKLKEYLKTKTPIFYKAYLDEEK